MYFFSFLFPLSHFFLIKIIDMSKDYKPSSKIVFDIPTALNFFCLNPTMTKQKIRTEVHRLVKAWNAEYEEKLNVSCSFLKNKFPYTPPPPPPPSPTWLNTIFNIFFQPLHDRSSFSHYEVLASHTSKGKGKDDKPIISQLILSISNWHFNRDKQYLKYGPKCRPEDVCVSIKLSSTAFASGTETGPSFNAAAAAATDETVDLGDDLSSTASTSSDDSQYSFDKNGVIIPYFAFVSLMDDSNFHNYLKKVLEKFEETEGSLTQLFLTGELNDVDENIINEDENEEADVGAKKKRKKAVTLAVEDDDNDNDTDTEDMGKRNRPSTPMAGVDFNEEEPLVSPAATAGSANKKTTTRKGITKK